MRLDVTDGHRDEDHRRAWVVDLVLLAEVLLLALALGRLGADLLEVLLEGREVLAGLGELALLHALADVPVDEGALGVHEVELVVDARERLADGRRVGDHADGAHDAGQVAAGDLRRRSGVDARRVGLEEQGFEPWTFRMQSGRSATELHPRAIPTGLEPATPRFEV